jgi:pyruvate ferredoxin oxidoreductase beta subunit
MDGGVSMSFKGVLPGDSSCPGCLLPVALNLVVSSIGKKVVSVVPASCTSVIQGYYPKTAFNFPTINVPFASAAPVAAGVSYALEIKGIKDVVVFAWAGDGGTADIGMASLSGAAERNDNILYIMYDNEAYMNTGIQRSGATPYKAWTTTTPVIGKREAKKDVAKIMIAHGAKYVATASVGFHQDFIAKIKKASSISGFRFIQLHLPCPVGWRFDSEKTVEVAKLAVETGAWILYEYQDGKLRLTGPSAQLIEESRRKPLEEYLSLQGRFSHLTKEDIEQIKQLIREQWEWIKKMI